MTYSQHTQAPYIIQGSAPRLPIIERAMKAVAIKSKKETAKEEKIAAEPQEIENKISIAITPEKVAEQPAEQPKKKKASKKKVPKESIQM